MSEHCSIFADIKIMEVDTSTIITPKVTIIWDINLRILAVKD